MKKTGRCETNNPRCDCTMCQKLKRKQTFKKGRGTSILCTMKHFKVKETCLPPFCTFETDLLILHASVLLSSSLWGFIIADHSKVVLLIWFSVACFAVRVLVVFRLMTGHYIELLDGCFFGGRCPLSWPYFHIEFWLFVVLLFPIKVWFWERALVFACYSSFSLLTRYFQYSIQISEYWKMYYHTEIFAICACLKFRGIHI